MSLTGIGRIGQTHILTSPQDDASYLFNGGYWCTYPLLGDDLLNGSGLTITAGSTLVAGTATLFTLLCNNFDNSNIPVNRYIAYAIGGGGYGILEVDYVIDDLTLNLKTPAFETATIDTASQINYFGTPILKEVCISPIDTASGALLDLANKYSYNTSVFTTQKTIYENEGGVEPMLVSAANILTTLNY
jgi:hypothetical protein